MIGCDVDGGVNGVKGAEEEEEEEEDDEDNATFLFLFAHLRTRLKKERKA